MGTVEGIRRPTLRAQQLRREATPAERRLWRELSASGLGVKFSRQMPVGPYIADFLCRSARLVVELDGHSHDARPSADAERDRFMASRGLKVLRFANRDVFENLEGVLIEIARALRPRAHPPTPSREREGEL